MKHERSRKDQQYTSDIEGEMLRKDLLMFNEQEKQRKAKKVEQQTKMRQELETIIEKRKEAELEKQHKINMVEFNMNKKSLKDLGIVDKKTLDEYYEKNSPGGYHDGISMVINDSPQSRSYMGSITKTLDY